MIPRYQTEFMKKLWSDENKFRTWFLIEIAHLEAVLGSDQKDRALLERLHEKSRSIDWSSFVNRLKIHEERVHHDVIAFLHTLEEELGSDARLIHLGLTSSDIVDTAFSKLLASACAEIMVKLKNLIGALMEKALENQNIPCLGRTHGQAAEPTTFAIKLLGHCCELKRSLVRLSQAKDEISVGKFSGAVGVYAHTSPKVEEEALSTLGLRPETVATQVVARDRHAALFSSFAILAGSLERLALEIRLLSHGEVKEVAEAFSSTQKGSSAMPHKKNPVLSENISGLMRLMRSYAMASLENQALWHERDISHSSVERVIAPDATSILDFALERLCGLIKGLSIDPHRMKENLLAKSDLLSSQALMLALIKKGMMRQEAYELVQKAAMKDGGIKDNLRSLVAGVLPESEIDELFLVSTPDEELFFKRTKVLIDSSL